MSSSPNSLPVAGRSIRRGRAGRGPIGGSLIVAASAIAFSTAGLFTRLSSADVWTMLFWRGLFGGLFIAGFIAWQERSNGIGAGVAIGRAGLLAAACSTLATICFILALRATTVADVTIIYATAPFLAAGIAWLWDGEAPRGATLPASCLALLGVVAMVGGGAGDGALSGQVLGFAMTVLMALMMVVIRRNRHVSMLPAACLSAFACAAVALPWASPAAVTPAGLGVLLAFGTLQFGLGLLLLTIGTRHVSAARASLLGNLELPFAPLWVWVVFGERLSLPAAIGGTLVVAAIILDLAADSARRA